MCNKPGRRHRALELSLILVTVGLTVLLARTVGYKMIVLNLFYLPVVLAAFYLGRYRAGVLALFCVIAASAVTALDLGDFAAYTSPIVIGLAVTVWGAVLGLTAMLVGTLSDERDAKIGELHEAYLGVVEVLSGYLQNANPSLKSRSNRVAELSERVAVQLNLSPDAVDEIRVAALLYDMENIEVTAKVIRKAMGNLGSEQAPEDQHTFHGAELVQSLSSVLTGAFPLLLNQASTIEVNPLADEPASAEIPIGARIIRAARAYDAMLQGDFGVPGGSPQDVISEMRRDSHGDYSPALLNALERVVMSGRERRSEPDAARDSSRRVEAGV